jgi:putative membrane protein
MVATPPPTPVVQDRRRLHPLTPVLRSLRLALVVIAAISWRGYRDLGTQRWVLVVAGVAVLVLVASVISYLLTGYEVVGRELRITEGLVVRRTRAIPLERVQSVELVQPLLPRLFGLAELRLEVVGGGRTEAPLAYLTLDEARTLRARLLALARPAATVRAQPAGEDATVPSLVDGEQAPGMTLPTPPEQPVHVVPTRLLLLSQLARPHWWLLPIGIAFPIFDFRTSGDVGFWALAPTITAVLAVIWVPIRTLSADWQFTLAVAADGLRIRRGLLETRSQTVPSGRIQAVSVDRPPLWRIFDLTRATLHVAGVRAGQDQTPRTPLVPVANPADAERVLATAVPGFLLSQVAVRRPPSRAWIFAPLRRLVMGYQLAPTSFVSRDGLLWWRLTVVPYGRIQSVRLRQGPLQRWLRLATVHVDVAGTAVPSFAAHQPVEEARWLALELADRARLFRWPTGHS